VKLYLLSKRPVLYSCCHNQEDTNPAATHCLGVEYSEN